MSMQDPIADMLTQIRNGQMSDKTSVTLPSSRFKSAIIEVLKEEGFISDYRVEAVDGKPFLTIDLRYYKGRPVIERLERVSRPSLKRYFKSDALPKVRGGLGVAIVSTSLGVMTDAKARQLGLGGEVICVVE
jgi:small subunit ribosomal protein S8